MDNLNPSQPVKTYVLKPSNAVKAKKAKNAARAANRAKAKKVAARTAKKPAAKKKQQFLPCPRQRETTSKRTARWRYTVTVIVLCDDIR